MSKVVKRRWQSGFASGLPYKDRRSCEYEAYIPDPVAERPIRLDGDVAADVVDAEIAITRFDAKAKTLADSEALARLLLRAEAVAGLLNDLSSFSNSDDLPAVVQAAIAHAQFETIHPFVDGNGRIGRALIHLILRRRGLAVRVVLPVSLALATWSNDYIAGLT